MARERCMIGREHSRGDDGWLVLVAGSKPHKMRQRFLKDYWRLQMARVVAMAA
jgi:hypothetical protein